ncbi:MAG: hypothetical protein OEY14_03160, partial [Myxococcales bacterium]|nr:hypothetical protein [Myxococcales bacterium]
HRCASALCPGPRSTLEQRWQRMSALPPEASRAELGTIVRRLRPPLRPELPIARARGILAIEAPPALGRAWMADAPRPRRGHRLPPGLRATLRRLGTEAATEDPRIAAREQAVGLELMEQARASLGEEALGSTGLDLRAAPGARGSEEAQGQPPPTPEAGASTALSRTALEALLRAARRGQPGALDARVLRRLGALQLGLRGDLEGDRISSPWRRAGAELLEVLELRCRG